MYEANIVYMTQQQSGKSSLSTTHEAGMSCSAKKQLYAQHHNMSINPVICNVGSEFGPHHSGGRENAFTVELPLLISLSALSAATVLFMYMLSMSSISSSSMSPVPFPLASEALGFAGLSSLSLSSFPSSSLGTDGWFPGRSWSSISSHSLTSLYRTSVAQNGSCITFWMKGRRISAPVLLSYFLRILTSPG